VYLIFVPRTANQLFFRISVLQKYEFQKPTPIQAQAIPAVMSGRDVIGIAKTGSGKTLAFLLPMYRHILDQPPLGPFDGPIALIMVPTRELAVQIHSDCKKFKAATGIRVRFPPSSHCLKPILVFLLPPFLKIRPHQRSLRYLKLQQTILVNRIQVSFLVFSIFSKQDSLLQL
jgi:CRISPR/Cas system-associated endonuclease/helicase Cas3